MSSDAPQLSERESEILTLVATGATNQQIAHQLHISPNTVKVHLRNIFGKIGAASRTEAAIYAARIGLVKVADTPEIVPYLSSAETETPPAELTSATFSVEPVAVPPQTASSPADQAYAQRESGQDAALAEHAPPTLMPVPDATAATSEVATRRRPVFLPFALVSVVIIFVGLFLTYALLRGNQENGSRVPQTAAETPINTRWKTRAPMPRPRDDFAVAAYDGKLYVIGGTIAGRPTATVERYDPDNDVWVALHDKPTPVSHVSGVTIGGRIYVPGGEDEDGTVLTIMEAYDPRSQQWQSLPSLPAPRSRYALADFEGRLYLFGGWDGQQYRSEVFIYDPAIAEWRQGAPVPTVRRSAGAAVVDGTIYVIGGENESGPLSVNESYDPTSGNDGQWESAAPLPAAIATPAVAGLIDMILVFDPKDRAVVQYSATKDAWSPITIPATVAISTRAVPLSTRIFVFGSASDSTPGMVSEYQAVYTIFIPVPGT